MGPMKVLWVPSLSWRGLWGHLWPNLVSSPRHGSPGSWGSLVEQIAPRPGLPEAWWANNTSAWGVLQLKNPPQGVVYIGRGAEWPMTPPKWSKLYKLQMEI